MSDYIKREDALKQFDCYVLEYRTTQIKEMLMDVSSADVTPIRHGHWIKISPAGIYECSECGKNVMTSDIEAYERCHGCGAIMDGESDE